MKKLHLKFLAVILLIFIIVSFLMVRQPKQKDNVFKILQELAPANFTLAAELCEEYQFPESCIQYFAEIHSEKNLNATLSFCGKLQKIEWRDWCYEGVIERWNEWQRANHSFKTILSATEAIEICKRINATYKAERNTPRHDCYMHLGFGISKSELSFREKIDACKQIDISYAEEDCVKYTIGQVGPETLQDINSPMELCEDLATNYTLPTYTKSRCYMDIAAAVAYNYTSLAIKICDEKIVDVADRIRCKQNIAVPIALKEPTLAMEICREIQDAQYADQCRFILLGQLGTLLNLSIRIGLCSEMVELKKRDACHSLLAGQRASCEEMCKTIPNVSMINECIKSIC